MPTVFQDIGLAATVAFSLPSFLAELKIVIPEATADVKSLIADVVTPTDALITDIEVTIKGGNATAITADVQKSLADLIALFGALKAAIPAFKADVSGVYGQLAPTAQSIASSIGVALPAAIFAATPVSAAAV